MFVIGNITDQITSLIWGYLSTRPFTINNPILASYPIYQDLFFSFTHPWMSNEPLFFTLISLLGSLIGKNAYNFYLVAILIINFWAFWYSFKSYKYWWFGAISFNLSAYYYLHLGIHPELINIWALPLFYKLFTDQKYVKIPFFILFVTLISNYLGFTLIILMTTLVFTKNLTLFYEHHIKADKIIKDVFLLLSTSILLFLFLFRFFALNYFKNDNTTVGAYVINRSINDFTIFSARPWYFFMPSEKNPFLGKLAIYEDNRLAQSNNYLFHQRYPEEHGSLFLGFVLYLLIIISLLDKSYDKKAKILLGINLLFIFLLMLPPQITLKAHTVYLPSFVIYKVFPVFRVTTRLILALHLLILVYLIEYFEHKKYIKNFPNIIAVLTLLILAETYIPVKMRTFYPPPEYKYIDEYTDKAAYLSVYPYSKAREALFWLPAHQRKLANVPGVLIKGYDSKTYTENMFDPNYPVLSGYFLIDNEFLNLVPDSFILLKHFDNSSLFSKQ